MDQEYRILQRQYLAEPDPETANQLLIVALRSGILPEEILEILGLSSTMLARNYGITSQPPSLYFVCGSNDESDALEASRIAWLRNFKDLRSLWFKIAVACFNYIFNLISDPQHRDDIVPMFNYPRRDYPSHKGRKRKPAPDQEFNLLLKDLREILQFLEVFSSENVDPLKITLAGRREAHVAALLLAITYWSSVTAEEGDLDYGLDERVAAQERDNIWHKRTSWQGVINNLVEILHHILLTLRGSTGEPYNNGRNPRYNGCPFLKHWEREHGSLNPGYHLNFGATARLNELVDTTGRIDWFVVFSNCLAAVYHSYIFYLSAYKQVPWLLLHPKGRNLDAEGDPSENSPAEELLEALSNQYAAWMQTNVRARPDYRRLSRQDARLSNRFLNLLGEGNIADNDRRLVEIQTATDNVTAQLNQIQENVINAFPEILALRQRIVELEREVETEEETTAKNDEQQLEGRFWAEFGPIIEAAVIDYLARI